MITVCVRRIGEDQQDHHQRDRDRRADVDDLGEARAPADRGGGALQPLHLGRIGLLAPDVAEPVEVDFGHGWCSSIDLSAVFARDSLSARALGAMSSISEISG